MNFREKIEHHKSIETALEWLAGEGPKELQTELCTLSDDKILKLFNHMDMKYGLRVLREYVLWKEENPESNFSDWVDSLQ